ncbi:MAG: ImmA/IrrE family metallo-endopeptidase [Nitrospiraceae bacterium]|nr:MAG: ImmA/IrrE family metallo-endopeptidase [Nitrospiraceae bacterium]
MKMTGNLVPYIAKEQFDNVATEFLKKYCPEALRSPMEIPIETIARDKMNLSVEHVNITEDLSIYGQIFFTEGGAEVYKPDTDEFIVVKVKRGTVFIDPNVFFMRNLGCERNTLAHECLHWFKHKAYHTLQNLNSNKMAAACKCPTEQKAEAKSAQWTDEDWMEWQANGIAPKILMPKDMFRIQADKNKYLKKLSPKDSEYSQRYLELAVAELADFFKVSKQSATIRLKELGYIL